MDVSGLGLTAVPPEIAQLSKLQLLYLSVNQLTALLPEIAQLTNLEELYLVGSQLTVLPPEIVQLTSLRLLNLDGNQLTALPPEIAQLSNLEQLYLTRNQLTALPPEIAQLSNLEVLRLTGNQLTALPPEIAQLTKLATLSLGGNQLTTLPPEIAQLNSLKNLFLGGNPLDPELAAAATTGLRDLRAYLHRLGREGEPLWEAKLLLVGEGEVGKSTLLAALRGDPRVEDRDSTHGLEIKPLRVAHPYGHVEMNLQGWDFGGQAVYRPTHQLFFSAPAVYLVVWKPREGPELNFVEHWIRLIRHRAGRGARVIVVATHRSKGRVARIDEPSLLAAYGDMIAGFHHVDSLSGEGVPELLAAIAEEAAALPGMGRRFPGSWRQARAALAATAVPYVSYGEFQSAVAGAGLDASSARSFARNSHEMGRLIHYWDDPGLADLVVLRPDWLSRAISYVLEDQLTVDNKGLVAHARLAELWDNPGRPPDERYPAEVHSALLRLMEQFDLSYRVETPGDEPSRATTSLIAQLVPSAAVVDAAWEAETGGRSELTEVIEVLEAGARRPGNPEGLIFQLIVRLHRFSLGRRDYREAVHWSGGVVLDDGFNGRALLTVTGGQVRISVRAAFPQFLMGQLSGEVRWLLETFWKGLEPVVKVPCRHPCPTPGTGLFDLKLLIKALEEQRPEFPCSSCGQWRAIDPLLLGAEPLAAVGTTSITAELRELRGLAIEVRALRYDDLPALRADVAQDVRDIASQSVQAILSRADKLFDDYLRTQDDEAENGPRLFTLVPADTNWRRPGWVKQRFRLTLYCEHSRLPVPVLSNDPHAGVYELEIAREWVRKAAPVAKIVAGLLSVTLPAAKALAHFEMGDAEWEKVQAEVDGVQENLSALADSLHEGLGAAAQDDEIAYLDAGVDSHISGATLRHLHDLLRQRDPTYAGLEKVRNKRRQPIWVHPRFVGRYLPPPPVIP